MSETDLTRHTTVGELVAAFQKAEATIRTCFAALVQAQADVNAVFTLGGSGDIRIDASRYGYHDSFDDPDFCVQRMARDAWRCIVERLELRRMMSIKRWDELERQIKEGVMPAITEENVAAFAQQYLDRLPDMLTEAVSEVFDWLRPWNTDYKTNSKLEVGRRVVLTYIVSKRWSGDGFEVRYHTDQKLIALENVFNALDGNGQINKTHYSALSTAIKESGASGHGETPLFKFRVYGNGNMHLEFRRLDLLARFNQIAGGRKLRPGSEDAA
jgi:hypothetical protein